MSTQTAFFFDPLSFSLEPLPLQLTQKQLQKAAGSDQIKKKTESIY